MLLITVEEEEFAAWTHGVEREEVTGELDKDVVVIDPRDPKATSDKAGGSGGLSASTKGLGACKQDTEEVGGEKFLKMSPGAR